MENPFGDGAGEGLRSFARWRFFCKVLSMSQEMFNFALSKLERSLFVAIRYAVWLRFAFYILDNEYPNCAY